MNGVRVSTLILQNQAITSPRLHREWIGVRKGLSVYCPAVETSAPAWNFLESESELMIRLSSSGGVAEDRIIPIRCLRVALLQQSRLPQHCSMIPINPLGRHFAITKLDEDYESHVDLFACRRHTRQEPIHPLRMMELDAGFFGNAIFGRDAIE
jgi:hypothetical protein